MAIVDPEETKLFENIPVTITNKNELNERDLSCLSRIRSYN